MFNRHPWNSVLHDTIASYFECMLALNVSSLYFDVIANAGLAHFVMKELLLCEKKRAVGYYGFLIRIAVAIQKTFKMKVNLFFSLYQCDDEECHSLFPHPISRDVWSDFYSVFVSKHLDRCYVEAIDDQFVNDSDE